MLEHYVKMFCGTTNLIPEDNDDDQSSITQSGLTALLTVCYQIAMSNYGNVSSDNQSMDKQIGFLCPYVSRFKLVN